MYDQFTGSEQSPSATKAGGANNEPAGTDPLDERVLAAALAPTLPPRAPLPSEATPASAQDAPEDSTTPAGSDSPGQETLPPEQTPPASPKDNADGSEVLSQSDAQLNEALAGLDDTQRTQLVDMLQDVASGQASWNDLKKGHKLTGQIEQLKREFQEQLDSLKADRELETTAPAPALEMPSGVAKLKTLGEIQARKVAVKDQLRAVNRYLATHSGEAETVYEINGQPLTREYLVGKSEELQAEAEALPERAQQIVQQAQFREVRNAARVQIARNFPQLNDPENADAKATAQLLKDPRFGGEPHADYLALAMATGHRVLQAELAERKAKGNGGTPARFAGRVPAGKPHMGNSLAAPRGASDGQRTAQLRARAAQGDSEAVTGLLEASLLQSLR